MTAAIERRPGADAPQVNPSRKKSSFWPAEFYSTAVGKKWVMALTGIGLMGFVFVHMVGNLKMFLGRTEFDHYAEPAVAALPDHAARRGPVGLPHRPHPDVRLPHPLGVHAHRDEPPGAADQVPVVAGLHAVSFASRTMRWTGIIIGLYLIFHLADLTWGFATRTSCVAPPTTTWSASFERVPVAIIYILANIALGIHLFHGGWSIFQSLGLNSPRSTAPARSSPPDSRSPSPGSTACSRSPCSPASSADPRRHAPHLALPDHPTTTRSPNVALTLDSKIPAGPLADKWSNHKFDLKLVNPSNRRKFDVIVVGSGLAGAGRRVTR